MSDTTEWLVPKIEGVHMVSRPGDTVALQFPAGSEDVVLEILEEWVAALRSGESTTGEPPDQDSPPDMSDLPDLDPRMQQPAGRPQKRQLVRMNHKPRSAGTTRGDTVSHQAAPAQSPDGQPSLYRQDPMALALGTSQRPARMGKPPVSPHGPLQTRTRIQPPSSHRKGTVIKDAPKGKPLTQAQIDAWNKQQQEGQAIFQQLRQTRKPTDPQVTPEMAMMILEQRMRERGERYLRAPDDLGDEVVAEVAEVAETSLETTSVGMTRPSDEGLAEAARADMTARGRKGAQAPVVIADVMHLPAEVVTPSGTVPLETITAMVDPPKPAVKKALSEALGTSPETPIVKTPPKPLPKDAADRWAEQHHEWLGILRELKAKYEPGITVTKQMVDAEQKKRATARGEDLIPIAAPGSKESILEQQVPAAAQSQQPAASAEQLPLPSVQTPTAPNGAPNGTPSGSQAS